MEACGSILLLGSCCFLIHDLRERKGIKYKDDAEGEYLKGKESKYEDEEAKEPEKKIMNFIKNILAEFIRKWLK